MVFLKCIEMAQFKRPISLHFTLIPYLNYQNGQFFNCLVLIQWRKINSKLEARNSKQIQNPKVQNPKQKQFAAGKNKATDEHGGGTRTKNRKREGMSPDALSMECLNRRWRGWRRFHGLNTKDFNLSSS